MRGQFSLKHLSYIAYDATISCIQLIIYAIIPSITGTTSLYSDCFALQLIGQKKVDELIRNVHIFCMTQLQSCFKLPLLYMQFFCMWIFYHYLLQHCILKISRLKSIKLVCIIVILYQISKLVSQMFGCTGRCFSVSVGTIVCLDLKCAITTFYIFERNWTCTNGLKIFNCEDVLVCFMTLKRCHLFVVPHVNA